MIEADNRARRVGADDVESATSAVMALRHVTRTFGRAGAKRTVLRDLSLDIGPGTSIQIGGRNGSGKTTLLRVMTGILKPNAGEVLVDGLRPDGAWREYHRRIGFLSAGDRGLYVRLSVRDHLAYWTSLAFVARSERRALIDQTMEAFDLVDLSDRRSERLSQGQRQRLRIALAFVHRPQVLLLDEPRNSLDPDGLEILAGAVREALDRRAAVVWCSPPAEEQPVAFDRRLLLDDGQLAPA